MEAIPQHNDKIVSDPQPELVPTMAWQTDSYTTGNMSPSRRICGFSKPVLCLGLALIVMVIVVIAGGAAGGTLAQLAVKRAREQGQRLAIQNNSSGVVSTITRTVTQTPSKTASLSSSSSFLTADNGCPGNNDQILNGPTKKYVLSCDQDIPLHDLTGVDGAAQPDSSLIVSSINECIIACDNWNLNFPVKCVAAVFYINHRTDSWMPWSSGYCFLKNTTDGDAPNTGTVLAKSVA